MCASFKPLNKAQASLFTSHPLGFDYADDIYPNYETPLLFATANDELMQWRSVRFGMIPKWAKDTGQTHTFKKDANVATNE